MRARCRRAPLPLYAHLHHKVVLGAVAFGHFVVGHVGDGVEQLLQVAGRLVHVCLQGLVRFFQGGHFCLGGFGFVAASFFHQLSDGLGGSVHFGQVIVQHGLRAFALVVQCQDLVDGLLGVLEVLLFEPAHHGVGVLGDLSDGKHCFMAFYI